MRRSTWATVGAACAGVLLAGQVQAVPVTFNFSQNNPWTAGDLTFSSGAHSVTVGGFKGGTNVAPASTRSAIGSNGAGLVVCSGNTQGGTAVGSNCKNDLHTIDSLGSDEDVKFTFSGEVTLLSMTVSYWQNSDDFSLFVGGTARGNSIKIPGTGAIRTFAFSSLGGDLTDSIFHIGARGSGDTYKLKALTVDYVPDNPPQVPEPSTILLMGSGLAGLGLWRIRKSRSV